jgi:polysaccharide biosynthesis transport protein
MVENQDFPQGRTKNPESLQETGMMPAWEAPAIEARSSILLPRTEQEPVQRGLLEYRHVLWRKRWTLLCCILSGLAMGLVVTVYEQPTYVVRTSLEFQPRSDKGLLRAEGADESYDESAIATYEHVLQSLSLRERVVQRLQNQPPVERANQVQSSSLLLQGIEKIGLNIGVAPHRATYKAALAQAAKTLKAKTIPQTRIVEITCESALPVVASEFANGLVNEFMDEDLQSHWNSTQSTNKQLTGELQQLRAKMEESQRLLNEYAQKTGITFTSANATLVDDQLKRTQQDLAQAENDRVTKEARYKIAMASPPDSIAEEVDDPVLQNSKNQLADLKRQYADLSSTFTPAYFPLRRIQAQIAEVETAQSKERQSVLSHLKSEYNEAVGREAMFAATYQKHVGAATLEAQQVLQYGTLKNDFDANRQLYESVLQRVKELDVTSAVHASNIRVIDAAEPPKTPDRPNPVKDLGFGLFSGLVLGIGFVFWQDHVSATLWGPGEGPTILNLPELGVIPSGRLGLEKHGRPAAFLPSLNPIGGWGSEMKERTSAIEVASWQQQPALMTESFRRTVASILFSRYSRSYSRFSRSPESYPRVIVVTSPAQNEGKSTICSNLALALAEIKLRVLIIDGDLRKPSLHKLFDMSNTWGISNILEESTDIDKLPSEALCRETKMPSLYILTSGPPTGSVSQLMFSARLSQLIARCREEFDLVVVDTPPVLRVSDARALSRHSDGVVLVLRAGRSKLKSAIASTHVLMQDGSRILGTVLNDWDPRMGGSEQFYDGYYETNSTVVS